MIDVTTNKQIEVVQHGTAPGSILLPVSQLGAVRQLLDAHGFRYWVSEDLISFNGGPQSALIVLYHATDPNAVRTVLNQAS